MRMDKPPSRTYPAFGLSMLDKAMKEYFNKRRYPRPDMEKLIKYFRRRGRLLCFYCRQQDATRWDHLHPVNKGGATAMGNLVPACSSCNDSKQNRSLDEWYARESGRRRLKGRLSQIKKAAARYQKRFRYRPRLMPEELEDDERRTYNQFRKHKAALQKFLDENGITTGRTR